MNTKQKIIDSVLAYDMNSVEFPSKHVYWVPALNEWILVDYEDGSRIIAQGDLDWCLDCATPEDLFAFWEAYGDSLECQE